MTFPARPSGRAPDELRAISFQRHYTRHAEGSVLACFGETHVLCTASVEARTPPWRRDSGWLTAEYGMLPRATHTRSRREAAQGRQSGRTQEIQRLVGRSLRAVLDLEALAGFTITVDCDVLQADGGTRTASITGGYIAVADAVRYMLDSGQIKKDPLHGQIAAISAGIHAGHAVLDLDYAEDSTCETDMNIVMNDAGQFVELQGTAEGHALRREELTQLIDLATHGIQTLLQLQREALEG
ncbi:MAG: ribonuclease PH [Nevskiaceae bacterium]|nr:MAG: ribonuclease PH [Nevskiaceae bacterium]TBR71351.1 MAG: ribonuclease PH [Nevskiaceae bacterium]